MKNTTLKDEIAGDSAVRKSIRQDLGISPQQLYSWESGSRPIPLPSFIYFKRRFPRLDRSQSPTYDKVFSPTSNIKKKYLIPPLPPQGKIMRVSL